MEARKFSVHPQIIHSLITSQAGTLAKALLECVMNSVDAGATEVDITLAATRLRVTDNGQGFRSRSEIERYFEVFGFPHEQESRVYGQFGIGRAQLWAFARTVWRTCTFAMDVDIKKRGLDYDLREGLPVSAGVTIDGTLYHKLLPSELAACTRELQELAQYAPIPVLLNGKRISRDPAQEKWDHDTPDAWIRLRENGDLLVFNLGVLVRRYSSYTVGSGGVVVTKPGVRLALNMARNDILVSECEVWRRIRPFLQQQSDLRVRTKRSRATEAELTNQAQRFKAGELSFAQVSEARLITDILNRGHTLTQLANAIHGGRPLTVAEAGSRRGERAHRAKLAFVLAPTTLARFDVATPSELQRALGEALRQTPQRDLPWWLRRLDQWAVVDDLAAATAAIADTHLPVPYAQWTAHDKAALYALGQVAGRIGHHLVQCGAITAAGAQRQLGLGSSDTAEAWTDGCAHIYFTSATLCRAQQGLGGFVALLNVLVHEFLHDNSSIGSHLHDSEFYEQFHEVLCTAPYLGSVLESGYRCYLQQLEKRQLPLRAKQLPGADLCERVAEAAAA